MKLYHWARCSTCRQAREQLGARGARFEERDFFAEPLASGELGELIRLGGGVRAVFSFGSPSFRKLGRSPDSFSDEELADLILAEPRFLRRPLLVDHGRILIGARAIEAG